MAKVAFTEALIREYETLLDTCQVRPERVGVVGRLIDRIMDGRARYEAVGGTLGIPWYFVGLIHCMECGSNFKVMWERGILGDAVARSAATPAPIDVSVRTVDATPQPRIAYSANGAEIPGTRELQAALARILGEALAVDGKPGLDTSEALRRVTGHYLVGDPRSSPSGESIGAHHSSMVSPNNS